MIEDKLSQLLSWVMQEEEKHYNLSYKELERNNVMGNMVMSAQASVFQKVRYAIEDLLNE